MTFEKRKKKYRLAKLGENTALKLHRTQGSLQHKIWSTSKILGIAHVKNISTYGLDICIQEAVVSRLFSA